MNGSLVVETLHFADGSTMALVNLLGTVANQVPTVANPIADQTAPEDAPFSFTIPTDTFTDQDAGNSLIYSASLADGMALPAWLMFDATTATFSGAPDDAQVGSLDLQVTATDAGGLSATSTFALAVENVNDAPTVVIPIADQTAVEDSTFAFTVPATTFDDVDQMHGDTLTYSASLADGTALPAWLSFDATTRTFGGTPMNGDVGTLPLAVTATDVGGLSISTGLNLSVQNVNDAPMVVTPIADQTANEDAPFAFTVSMVKGSDPLVVHYGPVTTCFLSDTLK